MQTRADRILALFHAGYNCAQAVFGAYADAMGLEPEAALRLASSFGGGMGGMRDTCGGVTAMYMVAGAVAGYADPTDPALKKAHYARIQQMSQAFAAKNGSTVCRELLGLVPGQQPALHDRSRCEAFLLTAAEVLAEVCGV